MGQRPLRLEKMEGLEFRVFLGPWKFRIQSASGFRVFRMAGSEWLNGRQGAEDGFS